MDIRLLTRVDCEVRTNLPTVYSVLVARGGHLVFEEYYQGCRQWDRFGIRSVTKSVISALIGIALRDRYLSDLDQSIAAFFLQSGSLDADPRKHTITIRHLLTMTAGFVCEEGGYTGGRAGSGDWAAAMLQRPLVHDPGAVFAYDDGASQILSAILVKVTGMSVLAFAQQHLFGPLSIATPPWEADPSGTHIGGWGLSLTARDMATFGALYLHDGRWNDRQIVPAEYVRASTTEHTPGGFPEEVGYGYHWWVTTVGRRHAYFAAGYGGQYIFVVPDLDLVAVTTARYDLAPADLPDIRYLITDFVVPAAEGGAGQT
jgi:CubicO group peptidase (beta-lactamase class C family)